jgi:Asp-tRNA(Asn)/Glu-tRNA(Gln) amidotransferase A subunit family amidase
VAKKWYSYFVVTDESTEVANPAAAAGVPPVAEPQRVTDVVADADAAATFTSPVEATVNLGDVYEAAKIAAPAHGYTVLKVADMLRSEHIQALPADVKRKSVMVALDAAGVKVTDIVEDAVKRDRALDTYERVLQKHLEERSAAIAAENARIEEEITQRVAELRARIDENTRALSAEQQEFQTWQTQKRHEEATIADAVSHFVSENPITTTRVPTDKGEVDVR